MVFVPVLQPQWKLVDKFSEVTERGNGGFGSSGKSELGSIEDIRAELIDQRAKLYKRISES